MFRASVFIHPSSGAAGVSVAPSGLRKEGVAEPGDEAGQDRADLVAAGGLILVTRWPAPQGHVALHADSSL